jgi:hypothetical protein
MAASPFAYCRRAAAIKAGSVNAEIAGSTRRPSAERSLRPRSGRLGAIFVVLVTDGPWTAGSLSPDVPLGFTHWGSLPNRVAQAVDGL